MIIDFNKIEEQALKEFMDGEKTFNTKMFSDNRVKIMIGRLEPGASIGLHIHGDSCEVIYVFKGCGIAFCDGEYEIVEEGLCHYCPKGSEHSLINNGDEELVFFAVVSKQ